MSYYFENNNRGGLSWWLPNATEGVRTLITVNALVFVACLINNSFMTETFALFYPTSPMFKPWQIITHMFMHGGFWHIFFNMYSLYIFGCPVERAIGKRKFYIFYFICGLGAAAMHLGAMTAESATLAAQAEAGVAKAAQSLAYLKYIPTVGASGAIYGVLIGYAMIYPFSRITLLFPPVTLNARTMVLIFAAIELFTGIRGVTDGVAHFAHLGGMLIGWLLIRYWRKNGKLFDEYGY